MPTVNTGFSAESAEPVDSVEVSAVFCALSAVLFAELPAVLLLEPHAAIPVAKTAVSKIEITFFFIKLVPFFFS